jgi:hypothetical protein
MTEAESYRAQGYVKHQGEWMTAAEARAAEATEQAAADAERRVIAAENAALEAQARAAEAEASAREAQDAAYDYPVYWGDWGYGVAYWPTTTVRQRPIDRPVNRPSRPVAPVRGGGGRR